MQTTLFAIAFTIIAALATALAWPFFVDWSVYRSAFEREASRLTGAEVRIHGPIDARLLPTPSVKLRDVAIAGPQDENRLTARELEMELSLGSLVRGEWRADEARLVGASFQLGIDAQGGIDWPGAMPAVSMDRLTIEDASAVLTDAASGARTELENLWFKGEVRPLTGPIRGEGGFVRNAERYNYRFTASRSAEAWRLRLAVDGSERPLTFESDGTLRFEQKLPHYEGSLSLARLPGVVLTNGRAVANDPWRATGKVKASTTGAQLEQLELTYGPEERAATLGGSLNFSFGARPGLTASLTARQLDLDRLMSSEPARRTPVTALRALNEQVGALVGNAMAVSLNLSADTLVFAGGNLQGFRSEIRPSGNDWELRALEFRGPGFAQVRAAGRLGRNAQGLAFTGPVAIDATEPRLFAAWLEGRPEGGRTPLGPLRVSGDLTLGAERIAIDRLKAELDRKGVAGRVAYISAGGASPARLEAELSSADLDIDSTISLTQAALAGLNLDMPSDVALTLDVERATIAGIEAREAKIKLTHDVRGLHVERLAITDLGGASVAASGRIENPWTEPRGTATLDLDGAGLNGIAGLLERFAPNYAASFRIAAPRLVPAKLRASITLQAPQASAPTRTPALLRIDGRAGPLRIAMNTTGTAEVTAPDKADLRLDLRLDSADASELLGMVGLEDMFLLPKGAASLTATGSGKIADLRVDARLAASGLEATWRGDVQPAHDERVAAADVTIAAANAIALQQVAGRPGQAVPLTLRTRVEMSPRQISLTNMSGLVAGVAVSGRLALPWQLPLKLDGRIETERVDIGALLGTFGGAPAQAGSASSKAAWSVEPFSKGLLGRFGGAVELRAAKAALPAEMELRQLRTLLRFSDDGVSAQEIRGTLGGGSLEGELTLKQGAEGLSASGKFKLTDAEIPSLLAAHARVPINGRASIQLEASGSGRSAATLIGALEGAGLVSAKGLQFIALDPRAFEAAIRATDGVLAIDANKIRSIVEPALDAGRLNVEATEIPFAIGGGQVRIATSRLKGEGADLTMGGTLDLAEAVIDSRLTLLGPEADGVAGSGRPEIFLGLRGPITKPARTLDISALVGWLTLRTVDLHAKRLEAAEAERRASTSSVPQPVPNPLIPPLTTAPAIGPPVPAAEPPSPSAPPRRPTATATPPQALQSSESAPALPPPIDIKPLPAPRRAGPRQPGEAETRPPTPAPNAGLPGFIDRLFGNQR